MFNAIFLLLCAVVLVFSHYIKPKKPTGYGLTFDPHLQQRDNARRLAEYERRLACVRLDVRSMPAIEWDVIGGTNWRAYDDMIFSPVTDKAFWAKHDLTRAMWWWRTAQTVQNYHHRAMRGLLRNTKTRLRMIK